MPKLERMVLDFRGEAAEAVRVVSTSTLMATRMRLQCESDSLHNRSMIAAIALKMKVMGVLKSKEVLM